MSDLSIIVDQNELAEKFATITAQIASLEEKVSSEKDSTRKTSGSDNAEGKFVDDMFDKSNNDEDPTIFYPADTYSFISLHSPLESPFYFTLGLGVFAFRMSFLVLMLLNIMIPALG